MAKPIYVGAGEACNKRRAHLISFNGEAHGSGRSGADKCGSGAASGGVYTPMLFPVHVVHWLTQYLILPGQE